MAVLPDDYPSQIMNALKAVVRPDLTISRPGPRSMKVAKDGFDAQIMGLPFLVSGEGRISFSRKPKITSELVAESLRSAINLCVELMSDTNPVWRNEINGQLDVQITLDDGKLLARIVGSESGVVDLPPVVLHELHNR